MFEDSVATIPSIWASMNSWFTPAVLFVLLNVMIGTIAFTSTLANQNKHHHQHQQQQQQHQEHSQNNVNKLGRSPSLLQRVRSINFYSYRSQEPNLVTTITNTTNTNATNTDSTSATIDFEISPDSNTLYNFEHTHQHETPENATHYVFDQSHQESQGNDSHMQYNLFQQNLQENGEETNTNYFFEQNNEGKGGEIDSHFEFQQENERENVATFEKEAFEGGGEDDDGGDELQSLDEVYSKLTGRHVSRTKSDTEPSSGEVPARLPTKMRKSASLKSAFGHFEEEDIVETRRPATMRERGVARATEADEEVDAKADDFINRFKQQLKLQRLDSLIRYKDLITRGSGK